MLGCCGGVQRLRWETVKRFSKERERESVCVWETNEMARNEKALKMKRDQKTEGKFRTRWGQFKGLLRRVIDTSLYLSLMPLKQVYCCGLLACHCSTPQKTRIVAVGQWNAAIDLMYSSSSKKAPQYVTYSGSFCTCRKKPAAITRFSCSVHLH